MNNVVSIRRTPKIAQPHRLSTMVVAGSGGAAATTTAYGLATVLRLGTGCEVSAVDATTDGGNLLTRTGHTAVDANHAIGQLESRMALTSAGVVVVGSGTASESPAMVDELLSGRRSARIHDVGTSLRSLRLTPLITSGAVLVVVCSARAEPLSRMRDAMSWLSATYGPDVLAETAVVISHQTPRSLVDLAPIRGALSCRIAGFVEVPFDPALARPGRLDHRHLAASTRDAWTDVLDIVGGIGHTPTVESTDASTAGA